MAGSLGCQFEGDCIVFKRDEEILPQLKLIRGREGGRGWVGVEEGRTGGLGVEERRDVIILYARIKRIQEGIVKHGSP